MEMWSIYKSIRIPIAVEIEIGVGQGAVIDDNFAELQ
jgi:hypothetical protein